MSPSVDIHQKYRAPAEWKKLVLIYLLTYLLDIQARGWLKSDSIAAILEEYTDLHLLMLQFSTLIVFGFFTLATYWVFTRYYEKYSGWTIALMILVTIGIGILMRCGLEEGVVKAITGSGNYNPNTSWAFYFRDNSIYAITYCGLGGIFFLVRYAAFQVRIREASQLELRKTELRFLRAQVNPHFLFNTLNNLYAMVNRGSDKALVTLEKLSGLLRYSLYEQQDKVPIQQEIQYLRDLIHLEELRIDGIAPVRLEIGHFGQDFKLPPLLLVPFVENAFKHGDLKTPDAPLEISLTSNHTDGLDFSVKNRIDPAKVSKDGTGGIGVLNVKKRLALLYPGRHLLDISVGPIFYNVQLQIHGKA